MRSLPAFPPAPPAPGPGCHRWSKSPLPPPRLSATTIPRRLRRARGSARGSLPPARPRRPGNQGGSAGPGWQSPLWEGAPHRACRRAAGARRRRSRRRIRRADLRQVIPGSDRSPSFPLTAERSPVDRLCACGRAEGPQADPRRRPGNRARRFGPSARPLDAPVGTQYRKRASRRNRKTLRPVAADHRHLPRALGAGPLAVGDGFLVGRPHRRPAAMPPAVVSCRRFCPSASIIHRCPPSW